MVSHAQWKINTYYFGDYECPIQISIEGPILIQVNNRIGTIQKYYKNYALGFELTSPAAPDNQFSLTGIMF